jgi:hypothetical protein
VLTHDDLKALLAGLKLQAERVARAVAKDDLAGLDAATAAVELAKGRDRLAKLANRLEGGAGEN